MSRDDRRRPRERGSFRARIAEERQRERDGWYLPEIGLAPVIPTPITDRDDPKPAIIRRQGGRP